MLSGVRDQRMIAAGLEVLRHAGIQALAVVLDGRHLAVHEPRGAHHLAAEHLHQGLMTETDAENRYASGERLESFAWRCPRRAACRVPAK